MTDKEKAKAYDEALKVARRLFNSPRTCFDISQLEEIFPALKESEDDRIRREIIDFIQWAEERGTTRHDYHQAKRPAVWIAYLERLKEPHYIKRNALFDKCVENCDPKIMKKVSDEVDEMLEKEQKPAEWSKEDDAYRIEAVKLLENPSLYESCPNLRQETIEWLKQLPKVSVNSEWSEEDDKRVKEAIKRIDELEFLGIPCSNVRNVLESLRNRPKSSDTWKPSNVQMEALAWYSGNSGVPPTGDKAIKSLYHDLQKLL